MSEFEKYQQDLKDILFPIYHNNYHKDVYNIDSHVAYSIKDDELRNFLHYWYIFQTAEDFDFDWYRQCKEYIESLSAPDKYRIRSYSHTSDEFVNQYLRNPSTFLNTFPFSQNLQKMAEDHLYFFLPDLADEEGVELQWGPQGTLGTESYAVAFTLMQSHISNNPPRLIQCIMKYIDHMRRILRDAPRASKDFLVFRGVGSDYLKAETPGMFRGFSSTTWYPQVAYQFAESERMIYEFRVSRNVPALCIHTISNHHEYEVLLDTDIYGVADRPYVKYQLDLYKGRGDFPAIHMWEPDSTELEGTPKRIYINSRMVLIAPDEAGLQGGFQTKNRTIRSSRYTRKSRVQKGMESQDLSSPTFVPTSSPIGNRLLRALQVLQQVNPRKTYNKWSTRSHR